MSLLLSTVGHVLGAIGIVCSGLAGLRRMSAIYVLTGERRLHTLFSEAHRAK